MSEKNNYPFRNTSLSFEERVSDLVSRLTLKEKVLLMMHNSQPVERLGIPEYNWWNECLHGVARAGIATVFPQAIGMAAMFDTEFFKKIAEAISNEARAKHHESLRRGDRGMYKGLNFWTPNINIFRDPRWGRGQETYGEDPFLTGRMAVAFIKTVQGEHPKYLKIAATAKHYAAHSGPEALRHSFDAKVSERDLRETYLAAFMDCVVEANVESIMGAYTRTNGEVCCASKRLLVDILRGEWGFSGHVVSDCGAICDFHQHHKVTKSAPESAALAIKMGCDLNCGETFVYLLKAVEEKLIDEEDIDKSLKRILMTAFKLGLFDPPEEVPYASIPFEINDCEAHRLLAREAAAKSVVLLKNEKSLLPLSKNLKTIAVIGPNADSKDALLGNYNGTPSIFVTPLEGIRNKVSNETKVFYAEGCKLNETIELGHIGTLDRGFGEALAYAERADVVIACLGLNAFYEGEQGDAVDSPANGDRTRLDLPGMQQKLLERLYTIGKPVVLVLLSGSALAVNFAAEKIPAILQAWYPGEEGGNAIADVLFGDYNPAGRLPVTIPKSVEQLPEMEDYNMRGEKGRTYRYMKDEPLYPFGFGLSYTAFEYKNLRLSKQVLSKGEDLEISAEVSNIGRVAGEEAAQLYLSYPEQIGYAPVRQLRGFARLALEPGETKKARFVIKSEKIALYNEAGVLTLTPGKYSVLVAGSQGDKRSLELGAAKPLIKEFEISAE